MKNRKHERAHSANCDCSSNVDREGDAGVEDLLEFGRNELFASKSLLRLVTSPVQAVAQFAESLQLGPNKNKSSLPAPARRDWARELERRSGETLSRAWRPTSPARGRNDSRCGQPTTCKLPDLRICETKLAGPAQTFHHRSLALTISQTARCITLLLCVACGLPLAALGQAPSSKTRPMVDQEPYDLITLNEQNTGQSFKILPLALTGQTIPVDPDPKSSIRIRFYEDDEKEYEVFWGDIARVETFPELLLREAERLAAEQEFDEAFRSYAVLMDQYSELSGIDASFNNLLYLEANSLIRDRRHLDALNSLEVLQRREPNYRPEQNSPELSQLLDRLVDRILQGFVEDRDFAAARATILRLRSLQGAQLPSLGKWTQLISETAAEKRDLARESFTKQDYQGALQDVRRMIAIWPEVPGGSELEAEIMAKYPLVYVGVTQPALQRRVDDLGNWASRRIAPLIREPFVKFLGVGPEGGRYEFSLGLVEQSDDQRRLTFRLNAASLQAGWTGDTVAQRLRSFAKPSEDEYLPAWGSLLVSVTVPALELVQVELRRPHVLPHAVLRTPLFPTAEERLSPRITSTSGPFEVVERSDAEVRFRARAFPASRLAEIVERPFASSGRALAALRKGEIDIVDRLFPADAARLQSDPNRESQFVLERYALPTVHMLLLNEENDFLARSDFRRAVLYGIDRSSILESELLGGAELPGCQLLSGPFPSGIDSRDPLAYAYDNSLAPRQYTPHLAKVLAELARKQASNQGSTWRALKVAYPPHELAQITCHAIANHLEKIGIECELTEIPFGSDETTRGGFDLRYVEVVVREPFVDAERMFGDRGVWPIANAAVRHALRQLQHAENWSEVREGLLKIHRVMHDEVAVIPLWQTIDYLAIDRRLRNVGERPLTLYQNLDQWRFGNRQFDD